MSNLFGHTPVRSSFSTVYRSRSYQIIRFHGSWGRSVLLWGSTEIPNLTVFNLGEADGDDNDDDDNGKKKKEMTEMMKGWTWSQTQKPAIRSKTKWVQSYLCAYFNNADEVICETDLRTVLKPVPMTKSGLTWTDIQLHWSGWSPGLRRLGAAAPLASSQTCSDANHLKSSFSHISGQTTAPTMTLSSYLIFLFGIAHLTQGRVCSYTVCFQRTNRDC